VRRPFQSSVFDRASLDLEEDFFLDVEVTAPRSRAGAVTTAGGGRYLVELEEALGGRVLRMVDAQLASVLGIFELADACELGADVCTYVEDIGGVVRSVRVAWLTGEVTEITIRSAARVA
jgi:hypothetical protein